MSFLRSTTSAMSISSGGATKTGVRIVSYNVLSSHLASPSYFTHCDPDTLKASERLPKVLSKFEDEMESKPIFCLQEVSYDWAGELHTFFANRNYHFITGLYGRKFNGYMGIALAYPTDRYETVATDVVRLSDKGRWPRAPKSAEPSLAIKATTFFVGTLRKTLELFLVKPVRALAIQMNLQNPPKRIIDPWDMSENRFNMMLTATLKDVATSKTFSIANYHMPCAFFAPKVMNIHAELAASRLQQTSSGMPHILAGDFNILPDSPHYTLLTTGKLDKCDPTYPSEKHGFEWESNIRGMRSAYAVSDHGEPDFTNYAQIKEDDPFIGTLDYIFLSDEWEVKGVKSTVHRDIANGPYPNKAEASDHILIAADLEL